MSSVLSFELSPTSPYLGLAANKPNCSFQEDAELPWRDRIGNGVKTCFTGAGGRRGKKRLKSNKECSVEQVSLIGLIK